jgi:hypothetical protein
MRQPHWVCSPALAERVWGFAAAMSIEDGMHETLAWYREQRWL